MAQGVLHPIARGEPNAFKLAHMMMTVLVAVALTAATAGAPTGKLQPEVSKEMMAAIVAANKALGLESWPMHDVKPCVTGAARGSPPKK